MNFNNIKNFVTEKKDAIVRTSVILGGTVVGLVVVSALLSKVSEENEDGVLEGVEIPEVEIIEI